MNKPSVGRMVHVLVRPSSNNGSDVAPAVITRVWNDEMVNVKVLLDATENGWRTSVKLFAERPSEDDLAASGLMNHGHDAVAFWPPRA